MEDPLAGVVGDAPGDGDQAEAQRAWLHRGLLGPGQALCPGDEILGEQHDLGRVLFFGG